MSTYLSPDAERTLTAFAAAFDGAAYAHLRWARRAIPVHLLTAYHQSGALPTYPPDCFALNTLLHQRFHANGYLPLGHTPPWHAMLFLYLHLYRQPLPEEWRHKDHYPAWASTPPETTEAVAAELRLLLARPWAEPATW